MSEIDVFCVGIIVADIFSNPLDRLPKEGEIILVDDFLLAPGGCAVNTAVDLSKLGASVAVAARVGNDIFADYVIQELTQKGIKDVSNISRDDDLHTSRTVILPVKGEDRRFIHAIGANAALRLEDIDLDLVAKSKVLYVGGYLVLPGLNQDSLVKLFDFARKNGVKTVLDVVGGSPGVSMKDFEKVLPLTDVFLPNEDEGLLITGESDPEKQSKIFLDAGAGTVVITQGSAGVLVRTDERLLKAGVFPVDVVDGSGAGDAFDAGFIIGLLESWDMERVIEFASVVGASCCMALGTTAGVFTRTQVDAFLQNNKLDISVIQ